MLTHCPDCGISLAAIAAAIQDPNKSEYCKSPGKKTDVLRKFLSSESLHTAVAHVGDTMRNLGTAAHNAAESVAREIKPLAAKIPFVGDPHDFWAEQEIFGDADLPDSYFLKPETELEAAQRRMRALRGSGLADLPASRHENVKQF